MKVLRKLTTLYFVGFGLLTVIILIAALSFNHIYISTGKITELTNVLLTKYPNLGEREMQEFKTALSEAEDIRTRAYVFFALALAFALGGVFLFVYIYRKNIVEPLHRITAATRKIAQGEFEELHAVNGTEISMLAENFNYMSRTLKDKIKDFESALLREQKIVRKLNVLNELIGSLIFKVEFDDVLATLIADSKTLIKAEFSAIALIDKFTSEVTHFSSSLPDKSGDIKLLASALTKEIIAKGSPLRFGASSENKTFKSVAGTLQMKNLLVIPIMIEREIRGVLIIGNKIGEDEFTAEDEDTVLMFTFQAAIAIERAIFHGKIVHLARTDGLTGLNNHRTFHEVLDVEIKRARRYNRPLALLMIDVDDFKKFNDTYGHQSGDTILRRLADILTKNLRGIDSAARYGGEEFTVILPETSLDAALAIAERIRNETSQQLCKSMCVDEKVCITVSVGVAVFPEDSMDKDGLIKAADDALYMTKKMGKNRVITFQQYESAKTKH